MGQTVIAFDIESTGINPFSDKIIGISLSDNVADTWSTDCGTVASELKSTQLTKVAHNGRFDRKFLQLAGHDIVGPFEDTILLAQLVDENNSIGLKNLVSKYFGDDAIKYSKELDAHLAALRLTKGDLIDPRVDQKLVGLYACEDTANTLRLFPLLLEKLSEEELDYYYNEMLPCEDVLMHMELRGVKIDVAKLNEVSEKLSELLNRLKCSLEESCAAEIATVRQSLVRVKGAAPEFNWNSSIHRLKLFYGQLGLGRFTQKRTKTGKPSLDGKMLKNLGLPDCKLKNILDLYLDHQTYSKLKSTYVDGIKERLIGDRIHAEFHQVQRPSFKEDDDGGTVTGRLSHRNPNLGNLPRATKDYLRGAFVKDLFIPDSPKYTWVYGDYAQIELRVAAHLSQDPTMCSAFTEGRDLHQETTDYLNTSLGLNLARKDGKTINFAIIYGAKGYRLSEILGWEPTRESVARCDAISATLLAHKFPQLNYWLQTTVQNLHRTGEVQSMFGRKRHLPEIFNPDDYLRNHALKQGTNFVVQSAAASICKRAMIALHANNFDIRDQVHDAIYCHVPIDGVESSLKEIKRIMEETTLLSVPLIVEPVVCNTFLVD